MTNVEIDIAAPTAVIERGDLVEPDPSDQDPIVAAIVEVDTKLIRHLAYRRDLTSRLHAKGMTEALDTVRSRANRRYGAVFGDAGEGVVASYDACVTSHYLAAPPEPPRPLMTWEVSLTLNDDPDPIVLTVLAPSRGAAGVIAVQTLDADLRSSVRTTQVRDATAEAAASVSGTYGVQAVLNRRLTRAERADLEMSLTASSSHAGHWSMDGHTWTWQTTATDTMAAIDAARNLLQQAVVRTTHPLRVTFPNVTRLA